MKLSRSSIGWLAGLVVLAVALGTGAFAPSIASAAPPVIDPSSCGQELGGGPVPNAYCSFETTGEDIVIGPDSCNVLGACPNLGNGVRINAAGLPFLPGSCNAPEACPFAGVLGGTAEIGGDSCNGRQACFHAGDGGSFYTGHGSCNGLEACQWSGYNEGSSRIGSGSCNGDSACKQVGEEGDSAISHGSCNGNAACEFAGLLGSFEALAGACNGFIACESSGWSSGYFFAGPGSCVGESACARGGMEGGSFTAGVQSCLAEEACYYAGRTGSFEVAHHSCNAESACLEAGEMGDGPPSVGSYSCNYSNNLYTLECSGDSSGSRPPVGDCMYNDPSSAGVIIYRTIGCALVGTPDLSPFEAIWQAILAAFAIN